MDDDRHLNPVQGMALGCALGFILWIVIGVVVYAII